MNEIELYKKVQTLTKELKELHLQLDQQRELNVNLKRIMRERANAIRELSPKKAHSGYVIRSSAQYIQIQEGIKYHVWKSLLQTPYNAGLPLSCIEDDIWEDLCHRILYPLGVRHLNTKDRNGMIPESTYNDTATKNAYIYRWVFKANYHYGLWEIELYHINELTVPAEFQPVSKKSTY